ncbi:YheC/YheD family protein [Shimazuella sp. AN120528]|uniref:YheC/YheD family endospore coat-associated protein n=1 Tax=Shimazuella soli TaxID=1892854 RepID=UPI001F0D3BCB|nr:YheC/YheD family protein [Shimazuella soli]MCH5584334.1 YheC/YheD family protein [Shimazuella soli]
MGLQKIQLQIVPEHQFTNDSNIIMSRSVALALGIKEQPFWVTFGNAADTAYLSLSNRSGNLVRIHEKLAKKLNLRSQPSIYAQYDEKAMRLKFGPLFGVLINTTPNPSQEHVLGPLTKFLDECVLAGITRGTTVAVFQPNKIELDNRLITAWIKEKGKWINTKIPFPDIIYNRITSRRIEEQVNVQKKLDKLTSYHQIPMFNERFLDKWQVHEILKQDESISSMLPKTTRYSLKKVKESLTHLPCLYLKPTNGSLGGGIIRLSKAHQTYLYQYATPNGTHTRATNSFLELGKILSHRIKKQPYIIQQGLSLITYDKRPVDFRVLTQKDKEGKWSVTSAVARIANDRQIVSNLARGGTLRKVHEVLAELPALKHKPTSNDIRQTAMKIANTFEQHAKGHFAELGIDLALDTNGRIWLLEINSKPSKTDDTVLNQGGRIRPSVSKLFDYVHFLAGIHSSKPARRRRR